MLAIRMQRTGRKGYAMFRMVVQDSRRTPTSGKIIANLGAYDPHAKTVSIDKEKVAFYLEHGAQPSERSVRLLKEQGVDLPKWVATSKTKQGQLRHPDKLRNQPKEVAPTETSTSKEQAVELESSHDTSVDENTSE